MMNIRENFPPSSSVGKSRSEICPEHPVLLKACPQEMLSCQSLTDLEEGNTQVQSPLAFLSDLRGKKTKLRSICGNHSPEAQAH